MLVCWRAMSFKLNDLVNNTIDTIVTPNETSYEIIWAADRKAPKKAYLELLDQPAIIIEWTLKAEIVKIYNIPKSKSVKKNP
jgi:hypothetical protein